MEVEAKRLFREALTGLGTRGLDSKDEALRLLSRLAEQLPESLREQMQPHLLALEAARDFVAAWQAVGGVGEVIGRQQSQVALDSSPDVSIEEAEFTVVDVAPVLPPPPLADEELEHFSWTPPPLPEAVMADFFAEVEEYIEEIAELVLDVPSAEDPAVHELYRKLHTIKGNSGMVGLDELQRLAHRLEDLVRELRDGRMAVSDDLRKVLADGAELAGEIIGLAQSGEEGMLPVKALLQRIDVLLTAGTEKAASPVPQPAAPLPPGPVPTPAPVPPTSPTSAKERPKKSGLQERKTLRVDFTQVDHLAALVGEQAVRHEEVLHQVERVQENIDDFSRLLDRRRDASSGRSDPFSQYLRSASGNLGILAANLDGATRQLDLVSSDLQRAVLDLRMVPLDSLFSRHRMTVFQSASAQGKSARLVVRAGDAKLDKAIVEKLEEPLIHLIRNAVSHGIQLPDERAAAGKDPEGAVLISASQQGNQAIIRVEDDGVGIETDVIRRKAVEKGFLTVEEADKLDDTRAADLIFAPGFSTTLVVDDISGRGLGLDVVRDKINRLNGAVQVFSELGRGTVFQLTLPLTLALSKVLLASTAGETVALPADSVSRIESTSGDMVAAVGGNHMVTLSEGAIPLVFLGRALGLTRMVERRADYSICVVSHGGRSAALVVDGIVEHTQAVIREVGPVLPRIRHCIGVTFHETGCVLVVDVGSVIRQWAGPDAPVEHCEWSTLIPVLTRDSLLLAPLNRLMRHERAAPALVWPECLADVPLAQVPCVIVDGRLADLEAVLQAVADSCDSVDAVLLTEAGLGEQLTAEKLYDLGVTDVLKIDDGWESIAAAMTRYEARGKRE